jgi:hypothetical protein
VSHCVAHLLIILDSALLHSYFSSDNRLLDHADPFF